ncbi:MAG: hypothetical protein A3F72_06075 [Bacteroidetes bacterium RIFCSPLOWO2_12_FULL_35_15]|nr:MAG: hypothetical protein A3F72_06075 [Bacteroidetes bacterium RIFCSPLOWO2_12_FULL_35_15]
MKTKNLTLAVVLICYFGFGTLNAFAQSSDTAQVSINYSNTQGVFSDYLFSTVAGPYSDPNAVALSKAAGFKFMEIGFEMTIPPNPNDSTQYNFSALDFSINEIINQGMEPYIVFQQPITQPTNLADYATYIKNVIRHYTQGWNSGYYYNLKAVRWGNEPDGPGFWQGTQQEFFDTYAAVSNVVKSLDSTIIIDAYGLSVAAGWIGNARLLNPWVSNFLAYCQANNVKVDVFTFHAYNPITYYQFYSDLTLINNAIAAYPTLSNIYGVPKLGNNEWLATMGDPFSGQYSAQFDSAWIAAHDILSLSAMTAQGLTLSIRYGGTFNAPVPNCHDFLLTDCNSMGKPSYFAFKGFNMLAGDSIVQTTGSDYINFSAISGKSTDTVTLVLSNFDALTYLNRFEPDTSLSAWTDYNKYVATFGAPDDYEFARIAVNNLPWTSDNIKVLHYLVDDNNDLNLVNTSAFGGTSNLSFTAAMAAPAVHVFKIFKESATGIDVQSNQHNYVTIFPNPSNGKFNLVVATQNEVKGKQSQIEIYNVLGECIYKSLILNPQSLIDISSQPKGIYFYRITNEQHLIGNGKIVIQ